VALDQLNLGHLADKNILLFFGIIRDYKGLDILLEVLSQLDDSFHLILAGESYGDFNKYEQQIDSLNIRDRCHLFQRYISDSEVATFFGAADVCMLTYKSATQSGITGIAQHFELPIVATPVGGLAETIIHGETGLICDDIEVSNIVSTVNTYFKEHGATPFRKAIALQNQQNSWPEFSRRLLEFIDELP
jgi:glycosyltransferase involved in cell wall biosynthesis